MGITFVFALFFSSFSDARLIVRGGAATGFGGGGNVISTAPVDRPEFISGTTLVVPDGFIEDTTTVVEINEPEPNNASNAAIPFDNRADTSVSLGQRCDPSVCEYVFDINDPFQLQGFSTPFGVAEGLAASYKWTVFEPPQPFLNGFTRGAEITSFDATDVQDLGNGRIDVFLDVAFPVSLAPGSYQLALVSVYQAPSGRELGILDENSTIQGGGPNGDFVLTQWRSFGEFYEFETMRFDLTLTQTMVSAPSLIIVSSLMLGLVIFRRRNK